MATKTTKRSTARTASRGSGIGQQMNREMAEAASQYRGNVPLKSLLGWFVLIVSIALVIGALASRLLISQRENQLIAETAARVAVQAEGRARLLAAWAEGVEIAGSNIAGAQLVRLYMAEMQGVGRDGNGLGAALRAQQPYMNELVREFGARMGAVGVHLVGASGQMIVSHGKVPETLASAPESWQRVVKGLDAGGMQPLRMTDGLLVSDIILPVKALTNDETKAPVLGVLWYVLPVGERLAELVAARDVDREGERTAVVQEVNRKAAVVGTQALAVLGETLPDLKGSFADGKALRLSVVDGKLTFATLLPVAGTPLYVMQEYKAREALGLMDLYKPGIYIIVALLVVVLALGMLAITLHLLAQRNRTRVMMLGQTMEAMVRAVEARDPHLAGHHQKVARLAVKVANRMELPVGERAALFYAAQLSSIGRLFVPADVLTKKGALTPTEKKQLRQHVQQATDILAQIDFDLPIVALIKQMYERMDGSGHPSGLKGDQISMMGRILGASDAFVALTSSRAHRKAFDEGKAVNVMMESGQFDPHVVKRIRR